MSDDIELPDGAYAPIQDTVCECAHWYDEHGNDTTRRAYPARRFGRTVSLASYGMCHVEGCNCSGFVADPAASTAEAVAARGGSRDAWPDHVRAGVLLHEVRDRIVERAAPAWGSPIDACELDRMGILVSYLGHAYRLALIPVTLEDVTALGLG